MVTSRKLPGTDVEVEIIPEDYPGQREDMRRVLRRFTADHLELESRRVELTAAGPEQWYAISDGRIYTSREHGDLLELLRAAGIDPAFTAMDYFSIAELRTNTWCDQGVLSRRVSGRDRVHQLPRCGNA